MVRAHNSHYNRHWRKLKHLGCLRSATPPPGSITLETALLIDRRVGTETAYRYANRMRTARAQPSIQRVALGFLLGPFVAAVIFSVASPLYAGLPDLGDRVARTTASVLTLVYPVTLIIGLPVYWLLRDRLQPSIFTCILFGAIVSACPWLLMSCMVPDEARSGQVITVHHHMRTFAGWVETAKLIGLVAGLGAVAGFIFWCCVKLGGKALPTSA